MSSEKDSVIKLSMKIYAPRTVTKNNIGEKLALHFIISIVGFIGTYATIFFGLLFLGGRSRSRSGMREIATESITFLVENHVVYLVLCVGGVAILNLYFLIKCWELINIKEARIDVAKNTIILATQKYYGNEVSCNSYVLDSVTFKETKRKFFISEDEYRFISFLVEGKTIGVIDMSDASWEKEGVRINELLTDLTWTCNIILNKQLRHTKRRFLIGLGSY